MWQPSWACPTEGYFYPPTLLTGVEPASTVAQVEIFGPVLVAMTFRTPAEAVALANNTRFGLAASVWSDDLNLALDISRQIKAGVVWVNCTNLFDASAGFGGFRESGYGREGGREGLYEYVRRSPVAPTKRPKATRARAAPSRNGMPAIDRTPKLFIGGKQVRPDGGYSRPVLDPSGAHIGDVGEGNRKDIRNAVEAARAAAGWANATAYNRAQVLYFIAENLAAREREFADRIALMTGVAGEAEVAAGIERLFTYAAMADKWDGAVHHTPLRNVTLAMPEAIGTIGIVCPDEAPLLGFVSLVAPAIAMGNTVIAIPSEQHPLAVTDLYQVLETSDLPGGVVNIVTGGREQVVPTLAAHNDVDAIWHFGPAEDGAGGRGGLDREPQADLGLARRTPRLVRVRPSRVPAPRNPGQEHLGPVRGVGGKPTVMPGNTQRSPTRGRGGRMTRPPVGRDARERTGFDTTKPVPREGLGRAVESERSDGIGRSDATGLVGTEGGREGAAEMRAAENAAPLVDTEVIEGGESDEQDGKEIGCLRLPGKEDRDGGSIGCKEARACSGPHVSVNGGKTA